MYLYIVYSFNFKLLQVVNSDLVNPLIPQVHYSKDWYKLSPLQIKPLK